MRRAFLISTLLVISTVTAYWPLRHGSFVNFDDPVYVTNNPDVFHGLTKHGFVWAFTSFHGSNWHPLTWLSHMLDCQLFADNAGAHHLVGLSIHLCNALLLFFLLSRMTSAFWRSAWVAALFALHPLHVESVAWISERKDVLSTLFELLALAAYFQYTRQLRSSQNPDAGSSDDGRAQRLRLSACYSLSLLLFALGLLSKPMLVTFPCLLLLLDFWPLRRFAGGPWRPRSRTDSVSNTVSPSRRLFFRLLVEKLPFFTLAVASSVITILAQSKGGALSSLEKLPLDDRAANAALSYLIYLEKAFWPTRLCVFYPFLGDLSFIKVALALAILLGITVFAFRVSFRAPYIVFGWLWFLGTLAPVIGILQVGGQAMADRYTYVPLIGIFMIIAWGTSDLLRHYRYGKAFVVPLAGGSVVGCLAGTFFQVQYWQNSLLLFGRALAVCPNENSLAHHNLGHALAMAGNQREAIAQFNEALRIRPGYAQAHFNRGGSLAIQGRLDEAVADLRKAIQFQPDYEQAYYHLASALALQLKYDEAKTNFLLALHFKPDYAEAHTKLANLLLLQDKTSEALDHLETAVRIRPDYEEGHYYLASALARQKRFGEAVAHFRAAVNCKPDYVRALNDLAWILAAENEPKIHDVPEAIRLATRACEMTHYNNPLYLDTLGVAFSEAGRLPEAAQTTERAVTIAMSTGEENALVDQIKKHLECFRRGVAYHDRLNARNPQ